MKLLKFLLILTTVLPPAIAFSQGLAPTKDSEYEFCQEQPPEPEWMQNLHVRESHKRLLIQEVYRLERYRSVASANNCKCATLYPPWAEAVQHFNDNYLHLEQFEAMQTRLEYQKQANAVRQSVKELCEAEGNW